MAQWVERCPTNQKVAGSIPTQSTCLGCRPGPQLGVSDRQLIDVSHVDAFLSLSLPLSLEKKKYFLKIKKKKKERKRGKEKGL